MSLGKGSGDCEKRATASSMLNWCNEAINVGRSKGSSLNTFEGKDFKVCGKLIPLL